MRSLTPTLAALVLLGAPLAAQDKPTVTVYPFGATAQAAAVSRDIGAVSSRRAFDGILASGVFNAKNETANPMIRAQLDSAGSLSQFNGGNLKRDSQLQSNYVLLGYVESVQVVPGKPDKNGNAVHYASLDITLQLYDVEKGVAVASELLKLDNGASSGPKEDCSKLSFMQRAKCNAKTLAAGASTLDPTNERAIAHAAEKVDEAAAKFLKENQERLH